MHDLPEAIVAVVAILAAATTVRTLVLALLGRRRERVDKDSITSGSDARFARLEQAVDAIALEVERISEGQRFTTKLLSEQARRSEKAGGQLSSNTPT